ncbi:hypothetical protein F4819DRAFT_236064 [Hypoxylon fuscum]|nr:hypothetical protein F4819DRAFT_236064 [Hypoxylon fuscum]
MKFRLYSMALSDEAIISMIALFVMCVPGLYFIFRIRRRRRSVRRSHTMKTALLPIASLESRPVRTSHDKCPTTLPTKGFHAVFGGSVPRRVDDDTLSLNGVAFRHDTVNLRETNISWSTTTFPSEHIRPSNSYAT